jgi:hypothetical protein
MGVNFYDVLSRIHMKATGSVEKSVEKDMQEEDPKPEEAKAILEGTEQTEKIEETDENTEGNDRNRSSQRNRKNSK